ncbi:hypothetical protein JOQ06_028290, partial [Pogonophryne albipinna]
AIWGNGELLKLKTYVSVKFNSPECHGGQSDSFLCWFRSDRVLLIWQKFQRPASGERKQTLICFHMRSSLRASQRPPGGCPAATALGPGCL